MHSPKRKKARVAVSNSSLPDRVAVSSNIPNRSAALRVWQSRDLFRLIANGLSADDLFQWELVCQTTRTQCRGLRECGYLSRRVRQALQMRGFGADWLDTLWSEGSIISGSCLLEILTAPTTWTAGDIDMYEHEDIRVGRAEFQDRFTSMADLLWTAIGQDDTRFEYDHYASVLSNAARHPTSISIVRTYQAVGSRRLNMQLVELTDTRMPARQGLHPIQLDDRVEVRLDEQGVGHAIPTVDHVAACRRRNVDFVVHDFDLDFLKITFDGKRLVVHDKSSIRDKKSMYRFNTTASRTVHVSAVHGMRCRKYTMRGYTIPNMTRRTTLVTVGDKSIPFETIQVDGKSLVTVVPRTDAVLLLQELGEQLRTGHLEDILQTYIKSDALVINTFDLEEAVHRLYSYVADQRWQEILLQLKTEE